VDGSIDQSTTTNVGNQAPAVGDWVTPAVLSGVLDLFCKAVSVDFIQQLKQELGLKTRKCIYDLPLVMWLMMVQRWDGKATLSTSVQQVAEKRPAVLMGDHKRIREGTVKVHTGAYSDARHNLPVAASEKVGDRVFEVTMQTRPAALPGWERWVFVLDGSSQETPHTVELAKAYPPARNRRRKSHWPKLRLLVAQELTTAIAVRPCWGPMYGAKAVSEQALTEQMLDRLPELSVLMGDINFGVFTAAFACTQHRHDVLFRMQPSRAQALGKGLTLTPGTEHQVCWRPSRWERKQHPELPADACVRGRLIVERVTTSAGKSSLLYFFTTLDLAVEQILELYGQRWNVETDIRSLKHTLHLQMLRCQSPDMIAKELILAIAGYNLVRAVMNEAAQQNQLNPRRLSFSRCQDVVNAALPGLDAAQSPAEYQERVQRMIQRVACCKLPDRSQRRPSPRAIWGHGSKFPKRKALTTET
jgi:putative transposase